MSFSENNKKSVKEVEQLYADPWPGECSVLTRPQEPKGEQWAVFQTLVPACSCCHFYCDGEIQPLNPVESWNFSHFSFTLTDPDSNVILHTSLCLTCLSFLSSLPFFHFCLQHVWLWIIQQLCSSFRGWCGMCTTLCVCMWAAGCIHVLHMFLQECTFVNSTQFMLHMWLCACLCVGVAIRGRGDDESSI